MLFEQAMEIHDPDHQPGTEPWSSVGSGPADMDDLRDALRQLRADRLTHDVEPQTLPGPLDAFALELSKREQADGFVLFGIEGDDPFEGLPDGGNPGDIVVTGDYDDPYDDWWETGGDAPGSGPGGPSGDGGGGGGGEEPAEGEEDDSCPYTEAYQDAAGTVGLLKDVLGILKFTPAALNPRDGRSIDSAIDSLELLEVSLLSGTISLESLKAH